LAATPSWNVLVIICDTLRQDYLGAYGNPFISTPALDRLAAGSVVFDEHWIGSFPTIPLRQDLLTGRHVFPFWGWAPLPEGQRETLATCLGRVGYLTQLISDNPHYLKPGMNLHLGFAGWDIIRGQVSDQYATAPAQVTLPCAEEKLRSPDEVRQYLRNVAGRRYETDYFPAQVATRAMQWLEANRDRPFFLWVDSFDVHEPWDPPAWYIERYDPGYSGEAVIQPRYLDRIDYLTEAELRHVRALYAAEVTMVDRWLGRLLDHLDDLDLTERTIVVFISDHGYYLGDHGYTGKHTVHAPRRGWPLYTEIARVPLFIRVPGLTPGRSSALIQAVDVHRTLLDLLGVERSAQSPKLHGVSASPLLRGESDHIRNLTMSSPKLPEGDDWLVWTTVVEEKWLLLDPGAFRAEGVQPRLYDRHSDPACERDLATTVEGQEQAERLHRRHLELLEQWDVQVDRRQLRRWPQDRA